MLVALLPKNTLIWTVLFFFSFHSMSCNKSRMRTSKALDNHIVSCLLTKILRQLVLTLSCSSLSMKATGWPWRFPDGEHMGVFMSAWASTQMRHRSGHWRAWPLTDPMARLRKKSSAFINNPIACCFVHLWAAPRQDFQNILSPRMFHPLR